MSRLCDQSHRIHSLDSWLDRIWLLSQLQWPLCAVRLCRHFRGYAVYFDSQSGNRMHCECRIENWWWPPVKNKWNEHTFDAIKICPLNGRIRRNQVLGIWKIFKYIFDKLLLNSWLVFGNDSPERFRFLAVTWFTLRFVGTWTSRQTPMRRIIARHMTRTITSRLRALQFLCLWLQLTPIDPAAQQQTA